MEPASRSAGEGAEKRRNLLVGAGNTLCGDDGVGAIVARRIYQLLNNPEDWDLEEICSSPMEVVERMAGYRRAVVVDALVDWEAPPGTIVRATMEDVTTDSGPPSHAIGFGAALGLARAAGLPLPDSIHFYGIVVRGPLVFGAGLSEELAARVEDIARQIADELATGPAAEVS